MNKIVLGLFIISINIFSSETYNIKKALYSEYSYEIKTGMEILSLDGKNSKIIPTKIKYNNKNIKKTKEGYIAQSSILFRLFLPNNIISEAKTITKYNLDKRYNLININEKTILDGKVTEVSCYILNKTKDIYNFNKKIGFKNKLILRCSDKLLRIKKIELKKDYSGNVFIELKDEISNSKMRIIEIKKIKINQDGDIKYIEKKMNSKIFNLNYKIKKIK